MSLYPTTYRDLTGNASIEAMELADAGGGFGLPDDPAAELKRPSATAPKPTS